MKFPIYMVPIKFIFVLVLFEARARLISGMKQHFINAIFNMFCALGKVYTLGNHNLTERGITCPTICTILCVHGTWLGLRCISAHVAWNKYTGQVGMFKACWLVIVVSPSAAMSTWRILVSSIPLCLCS